MWIVAYALRRPHTIGVLAIFIFLLGISSLRRMSTDILPTIDIPSVNVVWVYDGLNASEMAAKITTFSELSIFNNVDDVRSVHSETSAGVGIVRVELQPVAKIETALAQITAISQTILLRMPQGTTPPVIVRYSTGSVPILHLALSSPTLTEAQLYDYGRLGLRAHIQTIPGVRLTLPYGGQARQIMVDIDTAKLQAYGLSPYDVSRAVTTQNLTLPSGSLREGGREMIVSLISSPETAAAFNDLPLRAVDGRVIFLRDVASVRDGGAVVSNIARVDGSAGVVVSVLKLGAASTVEIVDALRARLPQILASAPEGMRIEPIFDQSVFVRTAMDAVFKEGLLVAALVATVVLVFLGSYRSAFIVLTSIPLSILAAAAALSLLGHSLNLMSLGGLSLAIGVLVDNAMVEIENINRNLALGKPLHQAILDGAQQIVFPEFVSTLSICIVFVPVFMLTGAPAYVFAPLAISVIAALAASFLLSRTLIPTLAHLLLPKVYVDHGETAMERALDRVGRTYLRALRWVMERRLRAIGAVLVVVAVGAGAAGQLGREFFPVVDAGVLRLHVRAPMGTRIEETAALLSNVQEEIRKIIPREELQAVVENIGKPNSVNLSWVDSLASVSADGELLIQLNPGHQPTVIYQNAIRDMMVERFPRAIAFFRSADIVGQTLNEGAAAAIDLRISGRDVPGNLAFARKLMEKIRGVPGASDVLLQQIPDWPEYFITVDRARALQLGVREQDVANALLVSLSSSATVQANYWADKGFSYIVAVQTPPDKVRTLDDVLNTSVASGPNGPILLRTLAAASERKAPALISRQSLAPTFNVLVNISGRDLGSVADDIGSVVASMKGELKPGNSVSIAGQAASMNEAYAGMARGLGVAVVLVFLVMVVNFQSWTLPLVIVSALPMTIAGAAFGLYATGTLLSTPALMGVVMTLGVSTANSVLMVSFARDLMAEGVEARAAILEAASIRWRPILMTATAMLVGMAPMALGLSEGGEQNAPLARAVIGGLLFGSTTTLLIVPVVFQLSRSLLGGRVRTEESHPVPTQLDPQAAE
jgi:multidrug efflux pump subunit AcrB